MPLAIDFSWSRPDPGEVVSLGYVGVIGYLSHDRSGKVFGDWKRYADAGLGVALVFEDSPTRPWQGYGAGRDDASFANDQADQLGFPGAVIFYAADTDDRGMGGTGAVVDYMRGAQSVGRRGAGIYGSVRVVDDVVGAGAAVLGWQATAWSGRLVSSAACLYQYARAVPLGGTDENGVLTSYWGQHTGAPAAPAPKEEAMQKGMIVAHSSGSWWFCRDNVRSYIGNPQTADILAYMGQSVNTSGQVPFVSDDVLSQYRDITSRGEVNV